MEDIGKGLIIGGSVGFSLWVTIMVVLYLKEIKRRRRV
jgi:uncharacterized membrane protein (Fun14 family)